ncbi:chemical-damaging agent resistance protein C [Flavobacterium branchiophilum NBRC 15030 = ATCC 35035]|uniref:TerZ/TerD family protein, possibly involved in tellurium resistance n=2 Tax=Flavobacterium branchiophilum TaxID=55197 RepID=G2Z3A1_FLABF|nr:TerD family protein [Flavobacterium branchiophilum]OXA76251.1 chemical-damaging agent resistance protein C [Flavobacterium branchiophilum NBRC 15030 = ATCC 35035]TQM40498.1 tellurium resistance protein TerD [Flavobacterium branchiophilum]GEM56278.1 chemical-damaging agent resistance protein C [Flavobacterium branchiophilum NBRC 15030 = ATCC 35035]CCB68214.1 TerZ/TerD family protein, possibly involved in tellurium resistance [Flavobacterium branchiophilum FL-15]
MAINLEKGQREKINVPSFKVGLGWDSNQSATGDAFDIDASVFILGANGKLVSDNHFVFFNNLASPDGAVVHSGDNLTGAGDGDDEVISIDLSKITNDVTEITFVVTIHKAAEKRQNFGQIRNSFIRVVNQQNNEEIVKYELDEDFSIETAVEFGRIYKRNDEWRFEAVGNGLKGGLQDFLNKYN